jgi:hypothetical protein
VKYQILRFDSVRGHMVNIKKTPLYKASSRIEAESWIATIGKSKYRGVDLVVKVNGNEWHVYKG